jgi:hypothetical protein
MTSIIKIMKEKLQDKTRSFGKGHGEIMGETHRTASETSGLSKQHFDRRQRIVDLRFESKKCWAALAKLYLDDAEKNRHGSHSEIDQTNGWITGVG